MTMNQQKVRDIHNNLCYPHFASETQLIRPKGVPRHLQISEAECGQNITNSSIQNQQDSFSSHGLFINGLGDRSTPCGGLDEQHEVSQSFTLELSRSQIEYALEVNQRMSSNVNPQSELSDPYTWRDPKTSINWTTGTYPEDRESEDAEPDGQSTSSVVLTETQRPRRQRFRNAYLRRERALTRQIGSCIRCRMQRIRVSFHTDGAG